VRILHAGQAGASRLASRVSARSPRTLGYPVAPELGSNGRR
jgi:hypothetical protein